MIVNKITEKYVNSMVNKVEKLGFRIHDLCPGMGSRNRNDFSRDYARVLYSSSFRRLQGKMQLLGIKNTDFFRNRLTHSLEVAQIAKALADRLDLDTTLVVETCSLAHDLGNSPFGHAGEDILNDLAIEAGIEGFEGNAQTLRILTTLEKKHYNYRGLNLTFRTLVGVIKYFNKFDLISDNKLKNKKFIYTDDYEMIMEQLQINNLSASDAKTIDMQIMDLADEIAYAAHDLEDCLSMDVFSIDELLYEFKISDDFRSSYKTILSIVEKCREFANNSYMLKNSEEYSSLFRKELTSRIVNLLIRDIEYCERDKKLNFLNHKKLANGLKKLVFKLLMRKPYVQKYEKNGETVIKGLYEVYSDEQFNKKMQFLPPEFREYDNERERKRHIIDFIAGMMDNFAVEEYKKYFGDNSLNKLYDNKNSSEL